MESKTVIKATVLGTVIIGLSIIIGSYIISRAPSYSFVSPDQIIDNSSGVIYTKTNASNSSKRVWVQSSPFGSNSILEIE